jgi:hypothetical protein
MKSRRQKSTDQLPSTVEVLEQLVKPGVMLEYPEKPIIINSPLSTVKKLAVNICSTEVNDMAILHALHSKTRTV